MSEEMSSVSWGEEADMTKNELRILIRQAIERGDMETALIYQEQLKKELDEDFNVRAAFAKDVDDFIDMGIWLDDY